MSHLMANIQKERTARNLSLQMPARDVSSSSTSQLSTNYINHVPLSPKLDASTAYASNVSSTVLPRRSRGLDFSRSCTNLHHSTLAEQSSPDSSPIIGGKAINTPRGKNFHNMPAPVSPGLSANSLWTWSTTPNGNQAGGSNLLGGVSMMDSDSDSESSDDDMMKDEDTIIGTPQAYRTGLSLMNPFIPSSTASPGMEAISPYMPVRNSLMSFQRRIKHRSVSSRKSSSSASGRSSMHSPVPSSPTILKSIESSLGGSSFSRDLPKHNIQTRRESLSLGTDDMHISDAAEVEEPDRIQLTAVDALGLPIPLTPSLDDRRSVIRRAVTRRSNMLPKPKGFARIRAALQEEGSPVDSESKREAEVIRQVRESDPDADRSLLPSQPTTTASSPNLFPTNTGLSDVIDDIPETELMANDVTGGRRSSDSFSQHALRYSAPDFWKGNFDERLRTPPPLFPRSSSSGFSEDMLTDTPASSVLSLAHQYQSSLPNRSNSRSSTPQPPMAAEVTRKLGKRRRDDDLDPHMFKRRAVSPGVSLQNSPILPSSPARGEGGWWQSKANREVPSGHVNGERVNSGGSNGSINSGTPRRIGLQGMNDTNDGLMNMSIE